MTKNIVSLAGTMMLLCAIAPGVWGSTHYVWTNSPSATSPYTNWATAAHVIQSAVNVSVDGDNVLATNGTYASGYAFLSRIGTNRVSITNAIILCSVNGPAFTIIDGGQSMRCVYLTNTASITGFTLQNGYINGIAFGSDNYNGAGVMGSGSFPSNLPAVSNCVICNNRITGWDGHGDYGGGAFLCNISYSKIISNSSRICAGGVSRCRLANCLIASNNAWTDYTFSLGGGALNSLLYNCVVAGNSVTAVGQALQPSWDAGGGVAACVAVNCTIVANTAIGASGGGVSGTGSLYSGGPYGSALTNCIVYANTPNNIEGATYSPPGFDHCCTFPAVGTACVVSPPLFLNSVANDFHLAAASPCIDAGTSIGAPATDFDGTPRPLKGSPSSSALFDIGAYEYASALVDSDHDGVSDYAEVVTGTNPLDSNSVFRITSITPATGHVTITWPSVASSAPTTPTRYYTVQYNTNNLSNAFWVNEPDSQNVIGTGSTLSYTTSSLSTNQALRVSVHW